MGAIMWRKGDLYETPDCNDVYIDDLHWEFLLFSPV